MDKSNIHIFKMYRKLDLLLATFIIQYNTVLLDMCISQCNMDDFAYIYIARYMFAYSHILWADWKGCQKKNIIVFYFSTHPQSTGFGRNERKN